MTYDLIQEQVLGSAAASVTFSSIPQGFKDLVLEMVATASGTDIDRYANVRFNGDAAANYSYTFVLGTGATPLSGRLTNGAELWQPIVVVTAPTHAQLLMMSYSNTSVNKTCLARFSCVHPSGTALSQSGASVGLWRSTVAISSILIAISSGNFAANSVFRLWGVAG